MGCNNGKMVRVEPQHVGKDSIDVDKSQQVTGTSNDTSAIRSQSPAGPQPKRINSATSNGSGHSKDSAFIEGDAESIISTSKSNRQRSGGLKRTLKGLSAKSQSSIAPLKDESSVLEQLRAEGLLLATDTHKSKNGLSFQLFDETVQPFKPPARLKSIQKRQQRRKLLTQQDIEAKLERAERKRKEAEAERVGKIQQVTTQSNIHNALDSFVEHQQQKKEQVKEKVDHAAENRAKKFREMREKLREKEEHAALVRQRKKSLGPIKITEKTELTKNHTEE